MSKKKKAGRPKGSGNVMNVLHMNPKWQVFIKDKVVKAYRPYFESGEYSREELDQIGKSLEDKYKKEYPREFKCNTTNDALREFAKRGFTTTNAHAIRRAAAGYTLDPAEEPDQTFFCHELDNIFFLEYI